MSVIRVKKDKNYFAASNIPFNDESLSWEARGVIGYLLSKPDDWQVKFTDLVRRGPAGDHKVRRILKELEDSGYLERERYQDDGGKFNWVSTVYETPTISRKSPDGSTIYGKSPDGDPMGGDTISRFSIDGKTTRGLSTRGKPRDITSTESPSTDSQSTKEETAAVFSAYENNIAVNTPHSREKLLGWMDEVPSTWIVDAINIAVERNKRSLSYVEGILRNWLANGKDNGRAPKSEKRERKTVKGVFSQVDEPQEIQT